MWSTIVDVKSLKVSAATAALLVAAAAFAQAQPANGAAPVKACDTGTVLTLDVSADTNSALTGAAPEIRVSPEKPGMVRVVAYGPILGSMDSRDLKPRVECNSSGFTVATALTRSANYDGTAAKNVLWRPRIELEISQARGHALVEARWTMRLSTGGDVKHARTPPYPEQTYPVSVKTEL